MKNSLSDTIREEWRSELPAGIGDGKTFARLESLYLLLGEPGSSTFINASLKQKWWLYQPETLSAHANEHYEGGKLKDASPRHAKKLNRTVGQLH